MSTWEAVQFLEGQLPTGLVEVSTDGSFGILFGENFEPSMLGTSTIARVTF